MLSLLLALGGLASTAPVISIYQRLREVGSGLALWSLGLGTAYGVLTGLQAVYQYFVANALSAFYANPKAGLSAEAVRAAAVVAADVPSPLNTYGFSKFFLSGLWLLIVGTLMMRSDYFPRALAYVSLVAGIGVILLFIAQATNTAQLIFAVGVPGSALVGPLFWLWVGYTLWTKE